MAKRKKQLNKNLIALLVSSAMLLTVAVVAVVTANVARRDPAQIAERAKAREDVGEMRDAIDLYRRAFKVDKEAKYLIDVSRCAYAIGEVRLAIGALTQAHSQEPSNVEVLQALIERYWDNRNRGVSWEQLNELSEKMLELQPDNLLALVANAKALEALKQRDPEYTDAAKKALERAVEIDALDPRVIEVRVREMFTDATKRSRDLANRGDTAASEEVLQDVRDKVAVLFNEAIAKHPDSDVLYVNAAQVFIDDGRALQLQIDQAESETTKAALISKQDEKYESAEALLMAGKEKMPESNRIMFGLSTYHRLRAQTLLAREETERSKRYITEGLEAVAKTLTAEPAEYDAYTVRANLQEAKAKADDSYDTEAELAILQQLDEGLADTVGLRTIKAVTNREARARMLATAFDRAYQYHRETQDEGHKAATMQFLDSFRERATQEFQNSVLVQLLDGQYFILTGDTRAAIQAFSLAEDKAKDILPRYELLAKEQLARLYTYQEENGVALKYTNAALTLYAGKAPMDLWLNRANLLIKLNQSKAALDQCDLLLEARPGDARVLRVKAAALHELDRSEEAEAVLANLEGSSADLMKARIAAARQEYDKAEQIVRQILSTEPENTAAMTLGIQVMVKAKRQDEALKLLEETQSKVENETTKRVLEAQKIVLQTKDQDERQRRLFEVIEQIDDPTQKCAEYFNYYYQREDYAKASEYAKELESLKPGDGQVYGILFELALRLEQYDVAEGYVTKLAELNADRAGGATYRGQLKRMQGDYAGAVEELRAAERSLPTDSNLKIQIGESLWKLGEFDATLTKLQQAVELDPTNFLANKLLYKAYEQLGREEEGSRYLLAAASLNPNDSYVKERQQIQMDFQDPARAITERESLREADPEDLDNLVKLGGLYLKPQTEDLEKALECLNAARELAPTDRRMAELLVDYYVRTDDMDAGGKLLDEYVAAKDRLTKINAQLLKTSFYARFKSVEDVEAGFEKALGFAEDLRESRQERWRRGRLQVLEAHAAYLERTRRFEDAIAKLQETLDLYPKDDERFESDMKISLVKIIQNLLKMNRLDEAGVKIEEFRVAFPDDVRWLNAKGELAGRRGESEKVRELMTLSIEKSPNDPWAYWTRGRANLALRQFDAARQDLLKVKDLSPKGFNLQHRIQLAQLYAMLEQYELAETELRELIGLRAKDQRLALLLIRLLRNTDQSERAQEFVNELITNEPENPFWPATLGQILMQRKEYSAAVRPFQKAATLTNFENAQIVSELLQAQLRSDRINEMLRTFDSLKEEVITPYTLVVMAEANKQRNNETEARQFTERALRDAAAQTAPLLGFVAARAATLFGQDSVNDLLRQAAPDLEPEAAQRIRWYLARGQVYGDDAAVRAEGMKEINALLGETTPGTVLHQEALLTKATGYETDKNYEEAVGVYEELLEGNPQHWQSLNNAAYLLTELGRVEQAVQYAENARQLQPRNANVLDTLGWTYYLQKRTSEAESILIEATSYDPSNLALLAHLGQLYQETGRAVEARRYYERLQKQAIENQQVESTYYKQAEEALKSLK